MLFGKSSLYEMRFGYCYLGVCDFVDMYAVLYIRNLGEGFKGLRMGFEVGGWCWRGGEWGMVYY